MTTINQQEDLETGQRSIIINETTRNPGMPLDMDWVRRVHINRSAVERRAATLSTRRTVKKEWQAAWLLRAITCIDLTTLAGDDTPGNVSAPVCESTATCTLRSPGKFRGRNGCRLVRSVFTITWFQ